MAASGRMEDVLRDAAGFQQFRRSDARSAHPTSQGATLRGLGGNASSRALILLDGVPMADPFGGWMNWAALDPARIGHIRVTRGGGSGVYGAGALGGTIEMSSIGPDDAGPLTAGVSYGSRNAVDADGLLSARLGGGFAMLSAGYARGDGFVPIVASQRGPIDEPARYEQAHGAARAVVPVAADTELQANGLFLLDRRNRGLPFTGNSNRSVDSSLRLVGHGRWGWEATGWLQIRQFSSGFASANAARTIATESLDQYNVPATGTGGRVEVRPPLGPKIALMIGADTRHVDGRTEELAFSGNGTVRKAGGQQTIYGGFADLSLVPVETLTLTAGARIDRWSLDRGFLQEVDRKTGLLSARSQDFPDRSGRETTARIGFAWKPAGTITLRSAAYTGWRLPTLNELYRPFRVGSDSTLANPMLNPERVKGVDLGGDYRPLPGWRLGFTLFWNRLDDAITNVSDPKIANTKMRQNIDAIRSRGVEVDAGAWLGEWRFDLSYAHADARVGASGTASALNGLRPAQTPRDQASASAEWNRPGLFRLGTTVRYVARQYEDDQNLRALRNALTIDAVAVVPVGQGFSIELRGENLGNIQVDAGISADNVVERVTPRSLTIGLRYALR